MRTHFKPSRSSSGFSLVEMLTVVAVIGIISSIAIPNIGNINTAAKAAAAQRNAQSVVSMFSAGQAAGVTWTGATRNALVTSVIGGQAPTDGAFTGKSFSVSGISGDDLTAAYKYIGMDADSNLYYDRSGAQSGS